MKETEVILSKTKKVCSILRIVAVIFFILFLVAYALYIGVGIYSQPFEAIAAPAFYAVVHGVAVETILILIILGLTDVKKGLSPFTYRQAKRFHIAGLFFWLSSLLNYLFLSIYRLICCRMQIRVSLSRWIAQRKQLISMLIIFF